MRDYDPDKLLVSIHLPKCGGTSLAEGLQSLFGDGFHAHYLGEDERTLPPRVEREAGVCVHGHFFHHALPLGVGDYYPQAGQFITVLREPLEMMLSSYFFQRKLGAELPDTPAGYLQSVLGWARLFHYRSLPFDVWADDAIERLEERFVWVGVTEDLQGSFDRLAARLGRPAVILPRRNTAPRTLPLDHVEAWRAAFRKRFREEYRLYDHCAQWLRSAL